MKGGVKYYLQKEKYILGNVIYEIKERMQAMDIVPNN